MTKNNTGFKYIRRQNDIYDPSYAQKNETFVMNIMNHSYSILNNYGIFSVHSREA